MIKRKIDVNILEYPAELHSLLQSGEVYDSSSGPDARTLYISSGFYLKISAPGALASEAALCRRFHGMGLGVEVMNYISADRDYFVTRSAPGEDLTHLVNEPEKLCQILAIALRTLHSQPIEDLSVSPLFQGYLKTANSPFTDRSMVDFVQMDRFPIASKQQAWTIMQEGKHKLKADTLIHGDACLPNVICHEETFRTFIDLGAAGVGDRHIDLFWAIWSLEYNLKTDQYTDYFLDQYGREHMDFDVLKVVAAFESYGET